MDSLTRIVLIALAIAAAIVWLVRSVRRSMKKDRDRLLKKIRDKNECIVNITALLKQEPTKAFRKDPFTIILWYGTSRIIYQRHSWNDLIMLVYADDTYVSMDLLNGTIPGVPLTSTEEWKIHDIRSALRRWERLPQTLTA